MFYTFKNTRQPQPGVMAYAFGFARGWTLPRQWLSDGYWVPQYFKPFSMQGGLRYNLPTTTIVGYGGLVQGQMLMQPLTQEPATIPG